MDIDTVLNARAQMERGIVACVTKELEAFKSKTGLTPNDISVHLIPVTKVGSTRAEFILGGVSIDVTL